MNVDINHDPDLLANLAYACNIPRDAWTVIYAAYRDKRYDLAFDQDLHGVFRRLGILLRAPNGALTNKLDPREVSYAVRFVLRLADTNERRPPRPCIAEQETPDEHPNRSRRTDHR